MSEVVLLKVFSILAGTIGVAIGIGLLLVPSAIAHIEKKLDTHYSTDRLEKILNERRELTRVLLQRPKVFGAILLGISFLLLLSNLVWAKGA